MPNWFHRLLYIENLYLLKNSPVFFICLMKNQFRKVRVEIFCNKRRLRKKIFSLVFFDWSNGLVCWEEIKKKCEEEINTSAEREIKIFHGPFITFFFINDLLLAASYFRAKKFLFSLCSEIKNHFSLSSEWWEGIKIN